ncbi:MAG TPA: M15 family metallopeptidase, partial [Pyrinomonadaceae bacterium]|nr:M15 family metallopeptidase [Pyrinomonadaceae bacterium]
AVKLTADIKERSAPTAGVASSAGSAFSAAAAQNVTLRSNLAWAFGGKQQRGWYLYAEMIGRTLGTESDPASGDFAHALSRWQQASGLAPTGVLDNDTWFKMFSHWQARRLKERAYPSPDQLVTAPASDFWDESRPAELRQVEREAYAAYKRMVAAAAADPSLNLATTADGQLAAAEKYLKIISAFRSKAYQQQLRKASPHSGSAGLAVNSPHFTGRALDIYVGGEPVETKDTNRAIQVRTAAYKWLVKNAERFGFRPYYYEPWHWEYVGTGATQTAQAAPHAH